jgi:hypothetical protein
MIIVTNLILLRAISLELIGVPSALIFIIGGL